jgi:hypothetical protein
VFLRKLWSGWRMIRWYIVVFTYYLIDNCYYCWMQMKYVSSSIWDLIVRCGSCRGIPDHLTSNIRWREKHFVTWVDTIRSSPAWVKEMFELVTRDNLQSHIYCLLHQRFSRHCTVEKVMHWACNGKMAITMLGLWLSMCLLNPSSTVDGIAGNQSLE